MSTVANAAVFTCVTPVTVLDAANVNVNKFAMVADSAPAPPLVPVVDTVTSAASANTCVLPTNGTTVHCVALPTHSSVSTHVSVALVGMA